MPAPANHAIFLSYAREDSDAARRIADALRSHGLEVWFDQNELRGGDAWDQNIRRQIKECALFVPLISAHTQERKEGYFRLEWKLAVERTHLMAEGVPFLTPVGVDDTTESAAIVPAEFLRVQWTRLPGALVTPQFVEQIKRLLGGSPASPAEVGRGRRAPPSASERTMPAGFGDPGPQPKRPSTNWIGIGLGIAVLALVGYIALRPARAPAPPVPATTSAAVETKAPPTPPPAPAAKILNKSIAVLPLDNMSEDKDTGFFADGVHEDLLTNLALVPELKVVSRTSVMQYRGTTKTMKQIGDELGVAYILEGSVRRAGNKVRVTGQLINTRTDEHVWAESYDRDLTDIFSIQAELSKKIAGALSAAISPETQKFLERRPTENPVAYDDYLKGRDTRNKSPIASVPALREAEHLFKSAVQQDPKFAAAWGELAVVHALNSFWGIDGSSARLGEADAAIAQAVRLAPDDPSVIESLGTYAYYGYRDYARATEQYEKLARLRPNDATVFSSLGLIQRRQGRWADSLGNLRRAVELDPANVNYLRNLHDSLVHARRWDEVQAVHERLIAVAPNKLREQLDEASDEFLATGSLKAFDDFIRSLAPAQREQPVTVFYRKYAAYDRGDLAEFKQLDAQLPSFDEEEPPAFSALAAGGFYLAKGDPAAANARIAKTLTDVRAQLLREPANSVACSLLSGLEAVAGHNEEALRLAQKAADMMPMSRDSLDGPTYQIGLAGAYAMTGDKDRAIAVLGQVLQKPSLFPVALLRVNFAFASLRGDSRFEALLNDPKNNAPLF